MTPDVPEKKVPSTLDLSSVLLVASLEENYHRIMDSVNLKLFNDLKNIKVGDFVMEITSLFQPSRDFSRLGILVAIDQDAYGDKYQIKLLDGDLMWWSNCSFINISILLNEMRQESVKKCLLL